MIAYGMVKKWETITRVILSRCLCSSAHMCLSMDSVHTLMQSRVHVVIHECGVNISLGSGKVGWNRSQTVDCVAKMSSTWRESKESPMAAQHSMGKSQKFDATPPLKAIMMLSKIPHAPLHSWEDNNADGLVRKKHHCALECRTEWLFSSYPPRQCHCVEPRFCLFLTKATWSTYKPSRNACTCHSAHVHHPQASWRLTGS